MKLSHMNRDCDGWKDMPHGFQSETDVILSLEDIERARQEHTSQQRNNAQGNNGAYHDSWGELDFDEELPPIRKITARGSSRHLQPHRRAGRHEGSNNKGLGPTVADSKSFTDSHSSRSLRRHQSDDELDYFGALCPRMGLGTRYRANGRSEHGRWIKIFLCP
jgi:hypothetical protein